MTGSILGNWEGPLGKAQRTPKSPLPNHQHIQAKGHPISVDCFTIIGREAHDTTRTIKEAMYIQVYDPSLKGTYETTNFHTFGMRSYKTHYHFILSNHTHHPSTQGPSPLNLPPKHTKGGTCLYHDPSK